MFGPVRLYRLRCAYCGSECLRWAGEVDCERCGDCVCIECIDDHRPVCAAIAVDCNEEGF